MSQKSATNGAVTTERPPRFASGAVDRLPLSHGDWVLVRRELTYGQQRRLAAAGLTGVDATATRGERLRVDIAAFDIELLVTWVVDWSFADEDGKRVDVTREAIEALHPDTAAEIHTALDAHIAGEEGKGPAPPQDGSPGRSKPGATSSSAPASAGRGPN